MLSLTCKPFISRYAECHYAEGRYAECHYAECRYAECHYAECRYAQCHYSECRYAECRYAECRCTECRGALFGRIFFPVCSIVWQKANRRLENIQIREDQKIFPSLPHKRILYWPNLSLSLSLSLSLYFTHSLALSISLTLSLSLYFTHSLAVCSHVYVREIER